MKIYLTRRGENQAISLCVISNRELYHRLISLGCDEAAVLADHLHGLHVTYIYTSPMPPVVEPSAIMANRLELG